MELIKLATSFQKYRTESIDYTMKNCKALQLEYEKWKQNITNIYSIETSKHHNLVYCERNCGTCVNGISSIIDTFLFPVSMFVIRENCSLPGSLRFTFTSSFYPEFLASPPMLNLWIIRYLRPIVWNSLKTWFHTSFIFCCFRDNAWLWY